ncbi:MAG: hypothetical protein H7066_12480 [Cytophagaceae bacterium]|nr:hypothetical protein [Gemmatimonadaceae bacterium]
MIPRVVCLSTDSDATDVLLETVQAILPDANVESADLTLLRDTPRSECVVVAVGALSSGSESIVRDLRARGYVNAIILVADSPEMLPQAALALLGVQRTIATVNMALVLPSVLTKVLDAQDAVKASETGRRTLASLRRLQTVIASGQIAARLQHRLNNPLAALLAEAQLLELEPLAPDHATSVRRMIELCRRIIEETKSIEGLPHSPDMPDA